MGMLGMIFEGAAMNTLGDLGFNNDAGPQMMANVSNLGSTVPAAKPGMKFC